MPFDSAAGLFWLLLPVAAASGWLAALRGERRRQTQARHARQRLSPHYFRGINYLLNEQPDKAIEVFIKMLEIESEMVETHLALGNLFRRRGEVDRAIRIHQNLIGNRGLSDEERTLAMLELGMDYMRAGLLDRAEELFKQLLDGGTHIRQSLQQLVDIYQQEQDWNKAIDTARRLEQASGRSLHPMIAHFYCEQAEESWRQRESGRALQFIDTALEVDPKCVRANLMAGRAAEEAGDLPTAVRRYRLIEEQDPDFLTEAMDPLLRCHRELKRMDEFTIYLRGLAEKHNAITPVLLLAELIAEREGIDAALEYLSGALHRRPSVRGLERLVHYALAHAEGRTRDNLLLLKEFVAKLLENKSVYRCSQCGFTGRLLHWQCPGCKNWNTVKPIHGIEGE